MFEQEARGLGAAALAARSGVDVDTFRRHVFGGRDEPMEAPWQSFGEDVLRALPLRWQSDADTRMEVNTRQRKKREIFRS